MRYSSSDVYYHEMPGGQYTNLKFQVGTSRERHRWAATHG
jgi:pyruvate carboxylase